MDPVEASYAALKRLYAQQEIDPQPPRQGPRIDYAKRLKALRKRRGE